MFKKVFLMLIILLNMLNVFGGTRDPYVSDAKYIAYGKDFVYVGKLCGEYKNGEKFCASAVAIDDHHILTAAHVVDNSKSCFVYFDEKKYCICEVIVHKDFNPSQFGIADISIGFCKKSFDLKFYPKLYQKDNEADKLCCMAGYGFHGTFNSGAVMYDGKKRAGSNRIDGIEKDMLICSPSTLGDSKRTSLEFLIAHGDSGGGLFIGNELAGINSCIMRDNQNPNSKYGDQSGHTRISIFSDWVTKHKTPKLDNDGQ
jgi:hypothetical protein